MPTITEILFKEEMVLEEVMEIWDNEEGFEAFREKWVGITMEYDMHIPAWQMEGADLQGPYWWRCLLTGDFRHDYNYSLGYTLRWRSLDVPLGVRLGVDYEWRGLYVINGSWQGFHRTSGLVGSAGLTWRVLGIDFEQEHHWNLFVDGGAAYVQPLTYNAPLGDAVKAGNGWRGQVAAGVVVGRVQLSLRYEWDTFDFLAGAAPTRTQSLVISMGTML